ncbi:TPA: hypothetical protein ACGW5B_005529 [Bacillus paranthracis]|uniref:hypothetical protein n=1 Tax=Bacillus TaxID=1386 RepID=UPI00027CCB29|nr:MULTISPECIES: hypothetical protein [unclassified Bacillus cereus group]AFQ13277.1 hypothetical protein BCK_27343 [Bacillus cereus FRI-35]MDX5839903.1 hypothetical protein [Bacillus cereus group sp. BfR-BA-01700]MDX5846231.1 hypothetical protein [Bacillus cereus group sp. BfR-BA-01233]MDX5941855.1 hypothetical protein [Bacillus cereus group sp. BfR-BA-00415]
MFELRSYFEVVDGPFKGYKELKFWKQGLFLPVGVLVNEKDEFVRMNRHYKRDRKEFREIKEFVDKKTWRLQLVFSEREENDLLRYFEDYEYRQRLKQEQIPITCIYKESHSGKYEFFFYVRNRKNELIKINDVFEEYTSEISTQLIYQHRTFYKSLRRVGYNIAKVIDYYEKMEQDIKNRK